MLLPAFVLHLAFLQCCTAVLSSTTNGPARQASQLQMILCCHSTLQLPTAGYLTVYKTKINRGKSLEALNIESVQGQNCCGMKELPDKAKCYLCFRSFSSFNCKSIFVRGSCFAYISELLHIVYVEYRRQYRTSGR